MRKNKHDQPMIQAWITEEAKKAALVAAYKAKLNLEQWISRAVIAQAKAEREANDK